MGFFSRRRAPPSSEEVESSEPNSPAAAEPPAASSRVPAAPPSRPHQWRSMNTMRSKDIHINYIVLGEAGLGKSTFIANLVSSFKLVQPGRVNEEGPTAMQDFKANPSSMRTVLAPMEVHEGRSRLHISIQDMPGWGEDLNLRRYLRTVVTFLLTRRAKDYDLLGGGNTSPLSGYREVGSSSQLMYGVTACLYFLPPHRVKPADLVIMSAVSQLVTVIPIIAKSDAMTDAELAAYRAELTQMLQQPGSYVPNTGLEDFSVHTFGWDADVLAALELQQQPFAVTCSREQEHCNDEYLLSLIGPNGGVQRAQPVREHAWGVVYPFARQHNSDLLALKRLLLGDQVEALQALLQDSHGRYVQFCDEYEEYQHELQALVQETVRPLAKPLAYDDYLAVLGSLYQAQTAKKSLQQENTELAEKLRQAEAERRRLTERWPNRWVP